MGASHRSTIDTLRGLLCNSVSASPAESGRCSGAAEAARRCRVAIRSELRSLENERNAERQCCVKKHAYRFEAKPSRVASDFRQVGDSIAYTGAFRPTGAKCVVTGESGPSQNKPTVTLHWSNGGL